jgi:hypothetical protein
LPLAQHGGRLTTLSLQETQHGVEAGRDEAEVIRTDRKGRDAECQTG